MLSSSAGASELRSAEAQLAKAGPTAEGSFLPAATPYTPRRLAAGALVKRAARSRLGQLTVHNDNDQDTVVGLVLRGSDVATLGLIRNVYITGVSIHDQESGHPEPTCQVSRGRTAVSVTATAPQAPDHRALEFGASRVVVDSTVLIDRPNLA
jgi:hypothetical protein